MSSSIFSKAARLDPTPEIHFVPPIGLPQASFPATPCQSLSEHLRFAWHRAGAGADLGFFFFFSHAKTSCFLFFLR